MIDVDVAMTYLDFVAERHRVWEKRQAGEPGPWTRDPILLTRKFTNVFRVLDFGTQFVLTDLFEDGLSERDTLMRCFLYRHTGRVEAWQWLEVMLGRYPVVGDLPELYETWNPYRDKLTHSLKKHSENPTNKARGFQTTSGERSIFTGSYLVFPPPPSATGNIFTGAYKVSPNSTSRGSDKLQSIIELAAYLFTPGQQGDIVPRFLAADTQQERFQAMRDMKGVGDFMAMQTLTDYGYGPYGSDVEDDFVVCGPGARRGAGYVDPTAKPEDVLQWAVGAVRSRPDCPQIGERKPSWMDIQNTLCEFSKYHRFLEKPLPVKQYKPAHPGQQPELVLPAHW